MMARRASSGRPAALPVPHDPDLCLTIRASMSAMVSRIVSSDRPLSGLAVAPNGNTGDHAVAQRHHSHEKQRRRRVGLNGANRPLALGSGGWPP
jgi:hypothetical protein